MGVDHQQVPTIFIFHPLAAEDDRERAYFGWSIISLSGCHAAIFSFALLRVGSCFLFLNLRYCSILRGLSRGSLLLILSWSRIGCDDSNLRQGLSASHTVNVAVGVGLCSRVWCVGHLGSISCCYDLEESSL